MSSLVIYSFRFVWRFLSLPPRRPASFLSSCYLSGVFAFTPRVWLGYPLLAPGGLRRPEWSRFLPAISKWEIREAADKGMSCLCRQGHIGGWPCCTSPLTEKSVDSVEIMLKLPRCPTLTRVQTFARNVICPFWGFFFFHRTEMTVCAAAAMTVPSHFHPDKDQCLGMKC